MTGYRIEQIVKIAQSIVAGIELETNFSLRRNPASEISFSDSFAYQRFSTGEAKTGHFKWTKPFYEFEFNESVVK